MTFSIQPIPFHLGPLPPLPTYPIDSFYLPLFFASRRVLVEGRLALLSGVDAQGKGMLLEGMGKRPIHVADPCLSYEKALFLVEKEEGKGIYYFATRFSETEKEICLQFDETEQTIAIARSQWWRFLPCTSKEWSWQNLRQLQVKDDRGNELTVFGDGPSPGSDYFKTGGFDLTKVHAPRRSKL